MDEFIPIGEAARMLGMNASALRYYEERGLVPPAGRRQGRRVYGRDELRRLVFLQSAQRLGIPLDTARRGAGGAGGAVAGHRRRADRGAGGADRAGQDGAGVPAPRDRLPRRASGTGV
ncbi:MerR family transcriptional regulator [Nonomuraea ferruginea]